MVILIKIILEKEKKELETLIETLQNEIQSLSPKPTLQRDIDYQVILADLQKRLESYVKCDEAKIPESVIEAFVEKIWVSKNEFRWYLRYDKQCEDAENAEKHVKLASFTIGLEEAKQYIYNFSTQKDFTTGLI